MEFTPTQEISNGQAKFSPNGSYIACIFKTKVDIWDSLYSKQLYSVKLQNPPQVQYSFNILSILFQFYFDLILFHLFIYSSRFLVFLKKNKK